jgi:hypothetical protein
VPCYVSLNFIFLQSQDKMTGNMHFYLGLAILFSGALLTAAQDPAWKATYDGDWAMIGQCIPQWNGCISGGYNPGESFQLVLCVISWLSSFRLSRLEISPLV